MKTKRTKKKSTFHAQKTCSTKVLNNRYRDIGQDEFLKVARHQTNEVHGDHKETIDGQNNPSKQHFYRDSRARRYRYIQRQRNQYVKNNSDLEIGDNHTTKIGKNDDLDVGENSNLTVGASKARTLVRMITKQWVAT